MVSTVCGRLCVAVSGGRRATWAILVTKTQTCTVTYKIKQDIAIVFAGIISLYKTKKMHLYYSMSAVQL